MSAKPFVICRQNNHIQLLGKLQANNGQLRAVVCTTTPRPLLGVSSPEVHLSPFLVLARVPFAFLLKKIPTNEDFTGSFPATFPFIIAR